MLVALAGYSDKLAHSENNLYVRYWTSRIGIVYFTKRLLSAHGRYIESSFDILVISNPENPRAANSTSPALVWEYQECRSLTLPWVLKRYGMYWHIGFVT